MAAPYVTSAEILAAVGLGSPSAGDSAWAVKCADAIEAIIAERLDGATPDAETEARLQVAAELDGARMFAMRKAPNGILAFGPDGDAVRMGSSQTFALDAVFSPGIA